MLSNDDYLSILKELKDYAIYHFKDEEKIMSAAGYKGLEEHKKLHKQFEMQIDKFSQKQKYDDAFDLYDYAAEWLINHILNTDQKYSDWVKEQISLNKIDIQNLFD